MGADTLIYLKFHGTPEASKSVRVNDFVAHLEGRTELVSIAVVLSNVPDEGQLQITYGVGVNPLFPLLHREIGFTNHG